MTTCSTPAECLTIREALSARLDGEDPGLPAAVVEIHLAGCGDCRAWRARAETLHRALRVRPAEPVPDLTGSILAATDILRRRGRRRDALRWALGLVAFCLLDMGLAQLLGVDTVGDAPGYGQHLFNESTAWNLALALGFLVGAWRPRLIVGQIPLVVGFVVILVVVSIVDLVGGRVEAPRLLMHVPVLVGLALMLLVHRAARRLTGPGTIAAALGSGRSKVMATDGPLPDVASPAHRGTDGRPGHLKPAGRRAA